MSYCELLAMYRRLREEQEEAARTGEFACATSFNLAVAEAAREQGRDPEELYQSVLREAREEA